MKRKQVSDDAFAEEPKHHLTNPKIKAKPAPKAPAKPSSKPQYVRMQVSFELPASMTATTAAMAVQGAIERWADSNPSHDLNRDSIQCIPFKKGFKL